MSTIRLIQFGDTHITRHSQFNYDSFKRGVKMLNTIEADYCIHVGDITEEGLREDYDFASLLLPSIRHHIIGIPGNHDVKNVGWVLYERLFGRRDFVHRDDRVLIIGIDASIPDRDDSRFSDEDLRFLERALASAEDRFVVVVFHNHLFPIPGAGRERNIIFNSGDVIELLQKYNVHLVLNGHKHTGNIAQLNNIVVINSGTFSSYKTRQGEEHSFNVVDISPERQEVTITTHWIESNTQSVQSRSFRPKTAEVPGEKPVFTLVQASDLQVSDGPDFLKETLERAVRKINHLRPDQVIICGNLVERGLAHEYALAKQYLQQIQPPVLAVPGSCDLRHLGKVLFRREVGDLEWQVDRDGLHFIGICTAQPDSAAGVIGRGKLSAVLSDALRPERINVAVLHHKLSPAPGIREQGYIEDAGSALAKFIDSETDLVLSGHRHVAFSFDIDGLVTVN
ncbi:MAG: metallophosphoesterase family protein, partial [Spirochaetota bacterium]